MCRTISSEQKKVSIHFQWTETSVDPFPVELSNYFLLVNFVDPFPDGHQFGPFPVELSIHFSPPGPAAPLRSNKKYLKAAFITNLENEVELQQYLHSWFP
jgi:hypothetical protein